MRSLSFSKHTSIFKTPGGTSRGVLSTKDSWILRLTDSASQGITGIGEVSVIEGLSMDLPGKMEEMLNWLVKHINLPQVEIAQQLSDFPAIRFGLECSEIDLAAGGKQFLFDTPFTRGEAPIPINGLIWMGNFDEMRIRIIEKLNEGYRCIKIKVGAIDFEQELELIRKIRSEFSADEIEIRVDANGGFTPENAAHRLEQLARYALHSIEQPIRQHQYAEMAKLCALNILPIALDEELIGVHNLDDRKMLLDTIQPQYIILKPSLVGGFKDSDEWIRLATERNIGWWATSALETNIGLNAIAQWTSSHNVILPQGLGTGQLFSNNFESHLEIRKGELWATGASI
ncbi:MAG: o-succinylbenzoate synthase [Bacteroidota bacterium]